MMKLYGAFWCDCVYESAYALVSLHKTKKGAYKAIRGILTTAWDEHRENQIQGLYKRFYETGNDRIPIELANTAWRIKEVELLE